MSFAWGRFHQIVERDLNGRKCKGKTHIQQPLGINALPIQKRRAKFAERQFKHKRRNPEGKGHFPITIPKRQIITLTP